MVDRIRRFELRRKRQPQWCNVLLQANRVTTYSGVIGSGQPESWTGGGKQSIKEYSTERAEAETHSEQEIQRVGGERDTPNSVHLRATGRDPVRDAWARVETWSDLHAPQNSEFPWAAGATPEELATLEGQIGQRLPPDFRAAYTRHNGSNRAKVFGIFALGYWMPLFRPSQLKGLFRGVSDQWQAMTDILREGAFNEIGSHDRPKGFIKAKHWNPGWIPFTCDDSGDFLCIDLDPPKRGRVGQVIFWWHEYGPYTVVADSFAELISRLAVKLDAGAYAFNESRELYPTQPVVRNFDQLLKFFWKGRA